MALFDSFKLLLSKRSCSKIWKEILREMRQYSTFNCVYCMWVVKGTSFKEARGSFWINEKKEGQNVTMYLEEVVPENPKLTRRKKNWQGIWNQIICWCWWGVTQHFFFSLLHYIQEESTTLFMYHGLSRFEEGVVPKRRPRYWRMAHQNIKSCLSYAAAPHICNTGGPRIVPIHIVRFGFIE